jgi:hypothetical protein
VFELPDREALRSIIERYARLLASVGDDLGKRPLVVPTSEFFPDRFTGDAASVGRLVERMAAHAGLEDVPLATRVIDLDALEAPHEGCSSGCAVPVATAAGVPRLVDDGDGFTLNVPSAELGHPVVLTAMIARALGHVFLVEAGAPGSEPDELQGDYAAVALGFGPILLEGAYIYSKSCGGPRVAQVTRAELSELAVLTAFFVELGDHPARKALRELSTTQASVLREALDFVASNRDVCRRLARDPARVAESGYELSDAKPWLVRLFGKKRPERELDFPADLAPRKPAVAGPRDPADDDLRSLVDEALVATRADAE